MSSQNWQFPVGLKRMAPKKTAHPVNFVCQAREAQKVFLVGDFNDWHPDANPMRRMPDGAWMLQVELSHGHHHYMFLVDQQMRLDPKAQGIARNEQGEKVSLIAVS